MLKNKIKTNVMKIVKIKYTYMHMNIYELFDYSLKIKTSFPA